ncbi:hypothetical protein Hanom_Chr07g00622911 [Helianthus anomalus]
MQQSSTNQIYKGGNRTIRQISIPILEARGDREGAGDGTRL